MVASEYDWRALGPPVTARGEAIKPVVVTKRPEISSLKKATGAMADLKSKTTRLVLGPIDRTMNPKVESPTVVTRRQNSGGGGSGVGSGDSSGDGVGDGD